MTTIVNLKDYGYTETTPPTAGLIPGRITELQRERYTVITERGEVTAMLKGSFYHNAQIRDDLPCVGDFVLLQYNETGVSLIAEILPRYSKFSRADFLGHGVGHVKTIHEQLVAVNFDYVFIVTSLNRDFRVNRIMRYLTQAQRSGGRPVVILTKADLVDDFTPQVNEVEKAMPGVPVHAISSHTGFGLDALGEYFQPARTVVFLGMSGVGKSSLLNTLVGEDIMTVRETRKEDESKGSHTTTHRQLFMLPGGAMVIDTPGMRELGLYDAEEGIKAVFSDIEELFSNCKFSNCRHETEPGCAVKAAIEDGTLLKEQWERYLTQKRENRFVDDKVGYMREQTALWKQRTMHSRKNKTNTKGKKR
ncbi:MAG: ribosome small subunit-dependent GTPase A [Firmicutes bacterium]|nr:ribosome small subunit-dependent GTPase A [Bacillota bacterium]